MNKKIEQAFNDHLNAELFSSYLYLAMANCFTAKNLDGMAGWMRLQAEEERGHGMKFLDFIHQRGGRVLLQQINQPQLDWATPLEAFQQAYDHELEISKRIGALVDLATKENDHAAVNFLQWFVAEQVEEEANALAIVDKLKMVGDNVMGILTMDGRLGQRAAG
ncbi:MAG: ferritin [Pirellulaceae bacterium]|nr:ferritin [Pirellulaceae bacterium]